jgi:hypothetical protein
VSLLAAALPVFAHHAFAAQFDINKPVTLKGTLTRIQWMNPHSWIHIDVKDQAGGRTTSWAIEFGAPNVLMRRGLRITDFQVGAEVEVHGFLAKNGKSVANAVSVKLPDGRDFFTGSSAPSAPGGGP